MSDTQGDLTRNPETVNHASNGKFERNILSYWTIPVFTPLINQEMDQGIAPLILAPQTLLTPTAKEVVVDAASGGAWINRTP